ncbi:MAG: hypothetical protein ACW964_16150 [Candidatus Hodarchaeales archaeon]
MGSEYLLKVIIVGKPLDLIAQMVHLQKDPKIHPPSLGFDFNSRRIKIGQSSVKLMLFSQIRPQTISKEIIDKYYNNIDEFMEDYREYYGKEYGGKLESPYSWYRGTSFCIITYDKSSRDSYNAVKDWYNDIRTTIISQDIPIALVGFITNSEEITSGKGQELADELDMIYFETKTTDKEGVIEIYKNLARKSLER